MIKTLMLVLLFSQISLADDTPTIPYKRDQVVFGNCEFTTTKFFPQEMAVFASRVQTGDDLSAAKMAVTIIKKSEAALGGKRQDRQKPPCDESDAHINAWINALRLWSVTTDTEAKKIIRDVWNKGFVDSPLVIDQVRALDDAPLREFIDNKFWNLFQNTHDLELLESMGYFIACYGNDQDVQHVKDRSKNIKTPEEWTIVGLTVSQYGRRSYDRNHPEERTNVQPPRSIGY